MKKYLLDTNICIYFLKGQYKLDMLLEQAGAKNRFISEVTVAELKFGADNSQQVDRNRKVVEDFINSFTIIPIFSALDVYAKEKARLRKNGIPLDDFDLLIGATAIANDLILVSRNVSDFNRIEKIRVENWIEST